MNSIHPLDQWGSVIKGLRWYKFPNLSSCLTSLHALNKRPSSERMDGPWVIHKIIQSTASSSHNRCIARLSHRPHSALPWGQRQPSNFNLVHIFNLSPATSIEASKSWNPRSSSNGGPLILTLSHSVGCFLMSGYLGLASRISPCTAVWQVVLDVRF